MKNYIIIGFTLVILVGVSIWKFSADDDKKKDNNDIQTYDQNTQSDIESGDFGSGKKYQFELDSSIAGNETDLPIDSINFNFVRTGNKVIFQDTIFYFSFMVPEGFKPYRNHELKWTQHIRRNPDNFVCTTFMADTGKTSMATTNIRLEYMSNKLPNCHNENEIFAWLKKHFKGQYSKLDIKENEVLKTKSGKKVRLLEILAQDMNEYRAWAYIPYGKDYYLGSVLTCRSVSHYSTALAAFKKYIRSYEQL